VILEIAGTIAALIAGAIAVYLQAPKPATAYIATLAENLAFYGVAFLFELKRTGMCRKAAFSMIAEFGPAEAIDTVLARPAFIYLGIRCFGAVGIIAGKVVADFFFYGIAFLTRKRTLKT
jgi:hypothetical protein